MTQVWVINTDQPVTVIPQVISKKKIITFEIALFLKYLLTNLNINEVVDPDGIPAIVLKKCSNSLRSDCKKSFPSRITTQMRYQIKGHDLRNTKIKWFHPAPVRFTPKPAPNGIVSVAHKIFKSYNTTALILHKDLTIKKFALDSLNMSSRLLTQLNFYFIWHLFMFLSSYNLFFCALLNIMKPIKVLILKQFWYLRFNCEINSAD